MARLKAKEVSLRVLATSGDQPVDTGTAIGRLMLAAIGAVGQAEREAMLERQREGIAKVKREGRYEGCVLTVRRQTDHADHLSTRQYARLVDEWVAGIGLHCEDYGTHSLRRTKASIIEVTDTNFDYIATAQLAVDGQIEQHPIT